MELSFEIPRNSIAITVETLKGIVSLFVILDPVGNIPIFMSPTANVSKSERIRVFPTALAMGFAFLLAFTTAGQQMLVLFGISVPSFMIAGGALLMIVAVRILMAGRWHEPEVSPETIGAVPIAFPLTVGPGAIATTTLNLQKHICGYLGTSKIHRIDLPISRKNRHPSYRQSHGYVYSSDCGRVYPEVGWSAFQLNDYLIRCGSSILQVVSDWTP